jgi:hypothetical protein
MLLGAAALAGSFRGDILAADSDLRRRGRAVRLAGAISAKLGSQRRGNEAVFEGRKTVLKSAKKIRVFGAKHVVEVIVREISGVPLRGTAVQL